MRVERIVAALLSEVNRASIAEWERTGQVPTVAYLPLEVYAWASATILPQTVLSARGPMTAIDYIQKNSIACCHGLPIEIKIRPEAPERTET